MIWLLFSGKYNSVTVKCFTCPESDKKHQSCPNVHHVKVCDHSTVILPGCRSRSRSKISMFCTDSSSQKGQSWCRLGNDFPMIYSVVNDLITRYSLTNLFVEILIQKMSHFSVFELDNSAYRLYSHPQQVQWRLSHCLISGSQFYSVAVIAVVEHLVFGGTYIYHTLPYKITLITHSNRRCMHFTDCYVEQMAQNFVG